MQLQNIKIAEVRESKTNPRGKNFKDKSFEELVASVKEQGILQPILVRKVVTAEGGTMFEIIAGTRRSRAAKEAGLKEIPAKIVEMDDIEAREAQIVENLQRQDIHPIEEGEACIELIKTNADIKNVAVKLGKSEAYVKNRIMLCNLAEEVKKAYHEGLINDGQALEITRLSPGGDQQKAATYVKTYQHWGKRLSVKDLKAEIERIFFNELAFQPWLKSKEAMAAVGPCHECPKETNTLFGEIKEGACTTTRCHKRKMKKYIEWMKEKTPGLILVSTEYNHSAGVLGEYDYEKAKKGSKGSKPALIIEGKNRGKLINIKVKEDRMPVYKQKRIEEQKHREAEQAKENRKMDNLLRNITWPLKENHLEPLFDLVMEHGDDVGDIAKRRQLEGKMDNDGSYADPDKVLRDFFAKSEPRVKMQLIVEVGLSGIWGDVNKVMKKFN